MGKQFIFILMLFFSNHCWAGNEVTLFNRTASNMVQRPISVPKVFKQGDIAQFAKASVPGVTQSDVKNRWPDGTIKFAIVSFLVDIPSNSSIQVSFSNQTTGNNSGFLTQSEMLDPSFSFDARIETIGEINAAASARDLLSQSKFHYWLQGPIVTAIILEDQDPTLPYDTTIGISPLHPIFEAWFYPANHRVDIGYTLENCWASVDATKSMRTLNYSLVLTSGTEETPVFSHPTFLHDARVRWHKQFWVGGDPGRIHIAHNPVYLISTRAVPNFDMSASPSENLIANKYQSWINSNHSFNVGTNGIGNFNQCDIDGGGSADWIGPMATWDVLWVMSQDERMVEVSLGNASLGGFFLFHFRERDITAGTGNAFDADEGATSGLVDTFGRVVSVNARKLVNLAMVTGKCSQAADDRINMSEMGRGGWCPRYEADFDTSHMPDVAYIPYLISGRYYYLEELMMQTAYVIGHKSPLYWGNNGWVCSPTGDDGYIVGDQIRGVGWSFRTLVYGAFMTPDATPEKDYFNDKLLDNIAFWEGRNDLPLSDPTRSRHYLLGQSSWDPIVLGGVIASSTATESPVIDTIADGATSPWMENFVVFSWGMARDMLGAPTDTLLKFMAKQRFNLLLNPQINSPALIEGYRFATHIRSTQAWISNWSEVNDAHQNVTWIDEHGRTTDHSYGYIALSAFSFLTPYEVDGYRGEEAWDIFFNATGRASGKIWGRSEVLQNNSPKWSLLPRSSEFLPSRPRRPERLRIR